VDWWQISLQRLAWCWRFDAHTRNDLLLSEALTEAEGMPQWLNRLRKNRSLSPIRTKTNSGAKARAVDLDLMLEINLRPTSMRSVCSDCKTCTLQKIGSFGAWLEKALSLCGLNARIGLRSTIVGFPSFSRVAGCASLLAAWLEAVFAPEHEPQEEADDSGEDEEG